MHRTIRLLGVFAGLGFVSVKAVAAPVVAGFERFGRSSSKDVADELESGLLLLTELNCVACHQPPSGWEKTLSVKAPLSLEEVGSRLGEQALARFIHQPHEVKPGTLMPSFGASEEDARMLAAFLFSLKGDVKHAVDGDAEVGKKRFHEIGCVACHAPEAGYAHTSEPGAASVVVGKSIPLALAGNYDRRALTHFLLDPLHTRPAGRMPSFSLSEAEAADLAAYLQLRYPPSADMTRPLPASTGAVPQEEWVKRGRQRFHDLGCVACHKTGSTEAVGSRSLPSLSVLAGRANRGCLHVTPAADIPHFQLDPEQRGAIRAALTWIAQAGATPPSISPAVQVDRFLTRMNCYACHSRQDRGGVEAGRAPYFLSTDPDAHSLGDMGHFPPALDHTGRKLTRAWMEKLLWGEGGGVRPYLATRMPKFGHESCAPVLDAWEKADERAEPIVIDTSGQRLHQRSANGRALMGTNDGGLGCITCHGLKDRKSLGVPVINLTHTVERLRPEYFKELILNPQSVQPGTMMPPMLMGRPKADIEVEQLWTYLKEVDQQLLPEGLLQTGEYELKPGETKRPVVFRTFLVGAGLQAVAVGFPEGRHVAFDGAEVRWALTWKGRFIDALTTWEERAMTPAKPLGDDVVTLPLWMPFATLASATDAWPDAVGTAAGYRDLGYRMDKDGIPTFAYQVRGLTVEDTVRPDSTGKGWRRTLTLSGGTPGWYFRGAAPGAAVRQVEFDSQGKARLEEVWP